MSQVLKSGGERNAVFRIRNLSVTFRKTHGTLVKKESSVKAVDNVSFDVVEGEALSVVGESGSGKTTVARCLTKLVDPTSGSIEFNGKEITRIKGRELTDYRKDVQIVYQDPYESLIPRLNVLSTLALPIRHLLGEKNAERLEDRAYHLLEEVGLVPELVLRKYPHQLSGGERQRVNIARALASDPKVLIADEPITMLDAALRLNILRLLSELRSKRNLTILLITHDLVSAKIISDRTIVMYSGRAVELGTTEEILAKPHHPYVGLIRDATPSIDAREGSLFGDMDIFATIEESARITQGCVYRPRCKYATSICSQTEPQLEEKSPTHLAACHNPQNIGIEFAAVGRKPENQATKN